jgi:hypothetical protein
MIAESGNQSHRYDKRADIRGEIQRLVEGGRNIRLDIWAKDSMGKYYNVEVQKNPQDGKIPVDFF